MTVDRQTTGRQAPSILLVAANQETREFCRRELEQDGYRVLLEGREGHPPEATTQDPPDLVILDTHLPRTNGVALMQQFMVRRQIPVILFSIRRARTFVEKNENLARLRTTVAQVLAQRARRPLAKAV
jgi:DNA-binding NtrC family response regulator